MPTGTTIQQFVNDLRDRESQVSRAFRDVYKWCMLPANNVKRGELATALRGWQPSDGPSGLPILTDYGLDTDLKGVEKEHICDWPDADRVRNAMVRALEDDKWEIEFWWDLDDDNLGDDAPSRSVIEPYAAGDPLPDPPATDLGGSGLITVTFLTPRKKVSQSIPTILGVTLGGINQEV